MNDLTVRELQSLEWGAWDRWLESEPWGSPFSSSWWLDASCRAFGGHPLILAVVHGEQLLGGVALRITHAGPVHMVRPSIVYNPVVIASGSAQRRQQILGALLDELTGRRLIIPPITLTTDMVDLRAAVWRHWNLTVGWTALTRLKEWSLDRDVSRAELQQLRKAHREGLQVSVEPVDVDILCGLMEEAMLRHGLAMLPTRMQVETLIKAAGTHGMQVVVRSVGGVPISSGFVMAHSTKSAYYIWAGTSTAGLAQGAAVARDICILKELQARGCERFDWCGASVPGVSDFKLKFGCSLTVRLSIAREPLWCRELRRMRAQSLKLKCRMRGHTG